MALGMQGDVLERTEYLSRSGTTESFSDSGLGVSSSAPPKVLFTTLLMLPMSLSILPFLKEATDRAEKKWGKR